MLHVDNDLSLQGYCDFDWIGCPLTRHSLIGWFVLLVGSLMSLNTQKKQTLSRSFEKVEYESMVSTMCKLKQSKQPVEDLGVQHPKCLKLYYDIQLKFYIPQNLNFYKTKHIEVDYYFVQYAATE